MSSYPFFIPGFVLCTNSSLFSFKIANEPSEFRNYLLSYNMNMAFIPILSPQDNNIHTMITKYHLNCNR